MLGKGNHFLWGIRQQCGDLLPLSHELVRNLWHVYVQNVDPVVRILHKPTMEKILSDLVQSVKTSSPVENALLNAIYFAAATSMTPDLSTRTHHNEFVEVVEHYRSAAERSLEACYYLNTQDLTVLQALVLYLVSGS